jgi:hypothetical protein
MPPFLRAVAVRGVAANLRRKRVSVRGRGHRKVSRKNLDNIAARADW